MKVGILTFHFSDNYGALFQSYGLKQYLESLGCNVEFVNYHPDYIEAGGRLNLSKLFSMANLKALYLIASGFLNKLISPGDYLAAMERFRVDVLGSSGKEYKEGQDISEAFSKYDLLICGSDQIWNPSVQYGVDPVYFLRCNKSLNVRKISYAPSFGSDALGSEYRSEVAALLRGLDAISVREASGADIVEGLIGNRPVVVPDPTIISGGFESIMKPMDDVSDNHRYCFLYNLRTNDGVPEACEFLKKEGMEVLEVHNPHRRWKASGRIVYPTPEQWLYLHKKSEFVITNSFHGVALSIVNKRPFAYLSLKGGRAKMNARAYNLIRSCGLEQRIVSEDNPIAKVFGTEIDWSEVERRETLLRNTGQEFLKEQLELAKK